jgi:hypothetical protein
MSANSFPSAIIGCEVDPKSLWEEREERYCEHQADPRKKFCPECGKPTGVRRFFVPRFSTDHDRLEEGEDLVGYGFKHPIDKGLDGGRIVCGVKSTDGERCFVGLHRAHVGYDDRDGVMAKLPPGMVDYQEETRQALEPLGLWNPLTFGLWAVQYWSY